MTTDTAERPARYLGASRLDDEAVALRSKRWIYAHGGIKKLGQDTLTFVGMLLNDPCCYCGRRFYRVDIDHITAPALGGGHDWENLTAACLVCNTHKGRHTLLWMVAEMGRNEIHARKAARSARREARARALYPEAFSAADQARDASDRAWQATRVADAAQSAAEFICAELIQGLPL